MRTYPQIMTLINRIDWVSGFANEVAFVRAIEKLLNIEPTERAQMIRLVLTELTRISNHLVFASSYPLELGAATPLMYAMRDREFVLDIIESVTGGRFHPNFNRVGGVKPVAGGGKTQKKVSLDLPAGFYAAVESAMDRVDKSCEELDNLVTGNEMIQVRAKGVGVISYEDAIAYGISGPNARASGVTTDLRKVEHDLLPYDGIDFDVITRQEGDSYARYLVRIGEIRESVKIVRQAIGSHAIRARCRPRCRVCSRCRQAASTFGPKTRRGRWATTSSPRAAAFRTGSRSVPPRSPTSRP